MSEMQEYVLKSLEMVDPKTYNKGFWCHFVQIAGKPKTLEKLRIWPCELSRFVIGAIYTVMDKELVRLNPDVKIKSEPKDSRYMEGENLGA